jgi:hypothetical protein
MGHFFMLLSLYLYLKYIHNHRYILPLILSTILLIMSHHLTTYFYLISLLGITLIQSINTPLRDLKRQVTYVTACSLMAFIYWFTVAIPVFNVYLGRNILGSPWVLVAVYYLAFFSLFLTFTHPQFQAWHQRQVFKKNPSRIPNRKRAGILFTGTVIGLLATILVFFFIPFPVTILRMNTTTLLYSIPIIIFTGITALGFEYLKEIKNRKIIQGWFFAIFISFIFAFITGDATLFPDRHIEYLMVPMSIIASYGLFRFLEGKLRIPSLPSLSHHKVPHRQWLIVCVAGFVIFTNGMAVYPAKDSIGGINETISKPSLSAIQWMNEHLDKNHSMVATDLRLSKMAWAEGFNTTFETTNRTWSCVNWRDCLKDLQGNETRGRITTIIIDDVMKTNVVNLAILRNVYMTNASYQKFSLEPFELLYRNETTATNGDILHWVEIYTVNWTYIENYRPPKHNLF